MMKNSTLKKCALILLVAVLALLALTGCAKKDSGKGASEWYTAEIEANKGDYPYHALLDIDQDGVEELFLSTTEKANVAAEDAARLLAQVDGKTVTLKEIGGVAGETFRYDKAEKVLYYYFRLSGESHFTKYNLENGELKEILVVDRYSPHHGPEDSDNELNYANGDEIWADEAQELWDQYEAAAEITYSA